MQLTLIFRETQCSVNCARILGIQVDKGQYFNSCFLIVFTSYSNLHESTPWGRVVPTGKGEHPQAGTWEKIWWFQLKHINQWLQRAFSNLCLVVARLVVTKHVDAGNSDYIALLCAVSVKVELVKTLQLLAMNIRSNKLINDTRFYTKRMV